MSVEEMAIEYVGNGWPVVPLAAGSKSPPKGMRWRQQALMSADSVRQWYKDRPGDGVGIRADKLIIVDIDAKGPPPDEIVDWLDSTFGLPDTRIQFSGGGGRHYIYAAPDDAVLSRRLVWADAWERKYPVDLLTGAGSYVVAEPSIHPVTGRRYAWALDAADGGVEDIADAPEWLIDACTPKEHEIRKRDTSGERLDEQALMVWSGYFDRTWADILLRIKNAERGTRHTVACSAGIQVGGLVAAGFIGQDEALEELINVTRNADWDEKRTTITAFTTGLQKATPWIPPVPVHTDADSIGRSAVVVPISPPSSLDVIPSASVEIIDDTDEITTPAPMRRHFEAGSEVVVARGFIADLEVLTVSGGLVADEGETYRYSISTGIWEVIQRHEIRRHIATYDGCTYNGPPDKKTGEPTAKRLSLTNGKIRGIEAIALDGISDPGWFESAAPGVLCKNGFLTVENDRIRHLPHSPLHRARWVLDVDYDPEASCPRFLRYLEEVFATSADADGAMLAAGLARTVQEFFGAALFGICTRFQKACVLVGTGANGKSVFLDVVRRMFPANAVTSMAPQKLSHEYSIAALAGKAINICAEVPNADVASSEIFKACISGDAVEGRQPYKPSFTVHPRAAHLFACNALPGTRDQSRGYWRRFLVVPFEKVFEGSACDEQLSERLESERAGILRWAVQGARSVLRHREIYESERSSSALSEWQRESDKVRSWIDSSSVDELEEPTKGMSPSALYSAFAGWSDKNGYRRITSAAFYRRLRGLGVSSVRTANGRKYALFAVSPYEMGM